MAHYEMYFCFPKTAWESNVPTEIKDKLKLIELTNEDTGEITYKSSITWNEAIFSGKLGAPRYSYNWGDDVENDEKFCIIKGEFSMKEGELSALSALGANKAYPNFSILTKSEAQTLAGSAAFLGE
jgi:hypothetical protein